MVGLTLEASGVDCAVGGLCEIALGNGASIDAEVVGFIDERALLMPIGDTRGLSPYARVRPKDTEARIAVGDALLGRVLDGRGLPLDGRGTPATVAWWPLHGRAPRALERQPIAAPIDVGVRAINGLLRIGRGQRVGLFAGSGVGKSSLLAMMTRYTEAEVVVVGLVGERGREVNEFVHQTLGAEGMARAVVVATPADDPPLMRAQGALTATAIAEYFREQGRDVLLLIDSLTRFAQAQREIGLAVGEPPTTKGYPPSVFARLPDLVERAGNSASRGSLTAIYTVLTEADESVDPIADSARAILDGHIVLSRALAESGHYPAIDLEASISRLMNTIAPADDLQLAQRFRSLLARYNGSRDLISLGLYRPGGDPTLDEAVLLQDRLSAYLRQGEHEPVTLDQSRAQLRSTLQSGAHGTAAAAGGQPPGPDAGGARPNVAHGAGR
ncbi:MAG: FliI/YscN family ATPase [Gammaproteobacteria bacterium]|nr:FliI/YscN family ATPase [Gammaproteobacteria bacterium]